MKKLLLLLSSITVASLPSASAQVIAQWTFEASVPTNAGPYSPEVGSGSALGLHVGAAVYSNPVGNGSLESFSANLWAVGDYWEFQVSTLGYSGIAVTYDQNGSSTGPRDFDLQYSLTGLPGSYTTAASYSLPSGITWSSGLGNPLSTFSFDLSSITSLDNAPTVFFRLTDTSTVSVSGGTVGTGGTDRVDNFTVAVVPEPSAIALSVVGGLAALVAIRRKR